MGIINKFNLLDFRSTDDRLHNQAFYKKWNSFSYISLFNLNMSNGPLGWGFAPKKETKSVGSESNKFT